MIFCSSLQPAPFVYQGICELFEMYLVHVFAAFADVSLSTILNSVTAEVRPLASHIPREYAGSFS